MKNSILFSLALILFACQSKTEKPLPVVNHLEINKYLGTWYEIARKPNFFETGLSCITANYSLKEDGNIQVTNKGHNGSKFKIASGTAKIPDPNVSAKLKVSFFGPFYADYQVIELDSNYQFAMVGEPGREYLWILSRKPQLPNETIQMLIKKAESLGYQTTDLIYPDNSCNFK